MTHFVNLWLLAFQLEWTMCCLPTDISGNLESRSKLLYASLTFLHNAQWGLVSQLRIFRFASVCPWGYHLQTTYLQILTGDPMTGSLEITCWILAFRWFSNPDPKFQEFSGLVHSLMLQWLESWRQGGRHCLCCP